jgi:hypothetical protein
MIHPTDDVLKWEDENASYEKLIVILKSNHFISAKEVLVSKGTPVSERQITGIRVEAASILQESKKARIQEVLAGYPVKVERISNKDFLLVTLKK